MSRLAEGLPALGADYWTRRIAELRERYDHPDDHSKLAGAMQALAEGATSELREAEARVIAANERQDIQESEEARDAGRCGGCGAPPDGAHAPYCPTAD